jgi:tetratricopeptide (TPR) repeat protein
MKWYLLVLGLTLLWPAAVAVRAADTPPGPQLFDQRIPPLPAPAEGLPKQDESNVDRDPEREHGIVADELTPPGLAPMPEPAGVLPPQELEGAAALIAIAQRHIDEGRYELAVRTASQSIAMDADNADAYKQIRSQAYVALGRYEEALADHRPLALTVTAPSAHLKTGRTILATVRRGSPLLVDGVRGNWLKVVSAGEQQFEWAWIKRTDVAPFLTERIQPPVPLDVVGPPYVYGYYPRPYHDYGRRYYDWQRHVPPRYWGFLP